MTIRRGALSGPLACFAEGFGEELAGLGYGERTAAGHLELLADLSGWLDRGGLAAGDLTEPRVTEFLASRRDRGRRDLVTARGMAPLLGYLRSAGVVPPASRRLPGGPAAGVLEDFRRYLASERGLAERGVLRYVAEIGPFARQVAGEDGIDWAAVSAADVTRFVTGACSRPSGRSPSSSLLAALRSFLRFTQLEGWTDLPLAQAAPSVVRRGGASLPRRLEPGEVRRLLDGCDRESAAGSRDYAILTLLIRLGLRAGEVARMQLDDIDWRAGEFLVRGKGQREEKLPLPGDAGEAVAGYLRHGRPRAASRAVFLRLNVPLLGLTPIGVTSLVYRACDRAGLTRVSAHPLRHTAATEMLRGGASLAEIGQALRQRSPSATAIYAKVDHATLRQLALPWPGGVA